MKSILLILLMTTLSSCATPRVKTYQDKFNGSFVSRLDDNILDTQGGTDIYFNAINTSKEGKDLLEVIAVIETPVGGTERSNRIDKAQNLIVLADSSKIEFMPIAKGSSLKIERVNDGLHRIHSQRYNASIDQLEKIAQAAKVELKLYTKNHNEGGHTRTLNKKSLDKIKEFINSVKDPKKAIIEQTKKASAKKSKKKQR